MTTGPDPVRPPHSIEDPPAPDLDDVQQREALTLVTVPVKVEGPVRVQNLPAKIGVMQSVPLPGSATPVSVLPRDLRRSVATLICDQEWRVMRKSGSERVRWPADVPLVITSGDEIWAILPATAQDPATLSVISEIYAD